MSLLWVVGMEEEGQEPQFGIGMVSRLTGISQHLLRMWERRYELGGVSRSASGRRLYSPEEVGRLRLIKRLLDRGDKISKIASLGREALEARLGIAEKGTLSPVRGMSEPRVRMAVLGDYLAEQLENEGDLRAAIDVVYRGTSEDEFLAAVKRIQPDALLLETAMADEAFCDFAEVLDGAAKDAQMIVFYAFARRAEVRRLESLGIRLERGPSSLRAVLGKLDFAPLRHARPTMEMEEGENEAGIPPRRFGEKELARLAAVSSTVDCECPKHLVDLVRNLSAFEAYSEACENKSPADAELHAYLHLVTARARARMEEALEKVAMAEGILPVARGG